MRTTVETFPLARESKATHDAPACRGPQTWPVAASRVAFGSRATLVRLYFASKSIAARAVLLAEEKSAAVATRMGLRVRDVYDQTAQAIRALRAAFLPGSATSAA